MTAASGYDTGMGRILAGALLLGVGALALPAAPACSLTNDCKPGDSTICTSATTYTECIGGEGQYHRLDNTCPAEKTCDPRRESSNDSPCVGSPAGGACTTDYSCDLNLHCENKVCVAPPSEAVAACKNAVEVTLSAAGEADVDLPLEPDVVPYEQALGGTCRFSRVALFRLAEHDARYTDFELTPRDPGITLASSLYPTIDCAFFFFPRAPTTDPCAPATPYSFNYPSSDRTFVVALASGPEVRSLHLHVAATAK